MWLIIALPLAYYGHVFLALALFVGVFIINSIREN